MTPVKPMLAEACKTFGTAFKKCPGGMYAEIKYDGERVQIHKNGDDFQFFSRSLKQVTKVRDPLKLTTLIIACSPRSPTLRSLCHKHVLMAIVLSWMPRC